MSLPCWWKDLVSTSHFSGNYGGKTSCLRHHIIVITLTLSNHKYPASGSPVPSYVLALNLEHVLSCPSALLETLVADG